MFRKRGHCAITRLTRDRITISVLAAWKMPTVYTYTNYIWWFSRKKCNIRVPFIYRLPVVFLVRMCMSYIYIRILLIAKQLRHRIHQQAVPADAQPGTMHPACRVYLFSHYTLPDMSLCLPIWDPTPGGHTCLSCDTPKLRHQS